MVTFSSDENFWLYGKQCVGIIHNCIVMWETGTIDTLGEWAHYYAHSLYLFLRLVCKFNKPRFSALNSVLGSKGQVTQATCLTNIND
jgi:hypothetical protein